MRAFRVGIAPPRPVGLGAPVAGIVGAEEEDVAGVQVVQMGLQLAERQRPRLSVGDVDGERVGDEALERDLVEGVAAGNVVGGRVDVRADVIEQVQIRHRVAILADVGDGSK
jgi:hypothetical protein